MRWDESAAARNALNRDSVSLLVTHSLYVSNLAQSRNKCVRWELFSSPHPRDGHELHELATYCATMTSVVTSDLTQSAAADVNKLFICTHCVIICTQRTLVLQKLGT